jgi:hypothetical protein
MKFDIKTDEIECIVADWIGTRTNLIVPNVSWGLGVHECDLLSMSKNGYLTEVEIKVSKADLKKDLEKMHSHDSYKIKYLYFAIPSYLAKHIDFIPDRAGILVITSEFRCKEIAKPKANSRARPLSPEEQFTLARLGALRIFNLKREMISHRKNYQSLREQIKAGVAS